MTHEQLINVCFLWHWNEFPEDRRMLYAVNNNISEGLLKFVPQGRREQVARQEGAKNKSKGVVAGILDFCYIGYNSVCWLDGKVGDDKLSDEQKDFIKKCQDKGHLCFTFRSLEEFQKIMYSLIDN